MIATQNASMESVLSYVFVLYRLYLFCRMRARLNWELSADEAAGLGLTAEDDGYTIKP